MAATNNLLVYSGSSQITCGQASLASGSTRESNSQNNSSNKYFDYLVALTFTLSTGTPSTTGPAVNLYGNGSPDGTLWPRIQLSSGAPFATTGGDASVGALGTVPNMPLIGSFGIQTTTSGGERTFRTQAFSVRRAFGGTIPSAFSVLIENSTGVTFSASTATTANLLEINGVYTSSGT